MLINPASIELLSLKIQNAIFLYRKNLIKKPGEWLMLAIYNNYKTSKQFIKYLNEKLLKSQKQQKQKNNPVDEYLIKTVFGYHTKFLRTIPSKELLTKELQKFNLPEQTINQIINNYPPEYIFFQIKHAEHRLHELKDPTAWLVNAITKVYKPSREFAQKIEAQIKQIKEEKEREEKNKKIEEQKKSIQEALEIFKKLPKNQQDQIKELAEKMLKELNITPETPGYNINLEYKIAYIILNQLNPKSQ